MDLSAFPSSSTSHFSPPSPVNTNLHNPRSINLSQSQSAFTRRRDIPPISITNTKPPSSSRSSVIRLATATTTANKIDESELESKKHDLLRAVQDTQRGLITNPDRRSSIEEALVCVEGYDAGTGIDLKRLDGTWRLQYTSASDVVGLLESAQRFPFFQVGQIFQKFECRDQTDGGVVHNVVQWSIPTLLEEQEGATLLVSANFSVVSKRSIYLEFEEISVQNFKISEELQAWIAPAILPRSYLTLQILQFLQTFKAAVPVSSPGRRSAGGVYYLSYLDNNMLLGRAVGGGGVFVFTKAQPFLL